MADFDPYHKWLGIPPRDQPPHHYRLLGIELYESDPEVIEGAAERHVTYLQSVATGPQLAESQRLLNEISAARRCLLTPAQKSAYDAKLREKLAATETPSSTNVLPPPVTPPARQTASPGGEASFKIDTGSKSPNKSEATTPAIDASNPATRGTGGKATTTKAPATPQKRRRKTTVWPLVIVFIFVVASAVGAGMFALGKFDGWLKAPAVVATAPTTATPAPAVTPASAVASASPGKSEPVAKTAAKSTTPIEPAAASGKAATLVAHFTFDDPAALAHDSAGTAHGENHGAASFVDPQRGTVLKLTEKSRVELPVKLTTDTTIAFWLRTGKPGAITSRWEFGFPAVNVAHDLRAVLVGNSVCVACRGDETVFDSERLVTNSAWHHVAIVRRAANQLLVCYIDGKESRRKSGWQETKATPGPMLLGRTELDTLGFDGLLDDLRVYSGAVSEAELALLAKPDTNANNKPAAKTDAKTPTKK
ncbi:MAG: hypothetical protein JNM18_17365 [Planctomycetaceae bacterium]|nr:hypothetical protein [Planctomycetaceae bacterium]